MELLNTQAAHATDRTIAIGDKAIVSGEVVGRQEQHIYQGATQVTHVRAVDETKIALTCALCGVKGTMTDGFHTCPGCARTVCTRHFERDARLCQDCHAAAASVRQDIYRQHALRYLANGRVVDPLERRRLDEARRTLGLPAVLAATLEQTVKRELPQEDWRPEDERQVERARQALLDHGDAEHAIAYLEPLAERHPEQQGLQTVWLEALAERDPARALLATEAVQSDVPAIYIVRARLIRDQGRYQEGMDLLTEARSKPVLSFACREEVTAATVELALRQFVATNNHLYLDEARERFAGIAASREPYPEALGVWLHQLGGASVDVNRLSALQSISVHARRVAKVIIAAIKPGTPAETMRRIIYSHARQPQRARAVAMTTAPSAPMIPPSSAKTFSYLQPNEVIRGGGENSGTNKKLPI